MPVVAKRFSLRLHRVLCFGLANLLGLLSATTLQAQPAPVRELIFEEGSGNTTAGLGAYSKIYGAQFSPDVPQGCNYSLDFDGFNDRVEVSRFSTPQNTYAQTLSVEAWIKPDDTSGTHTIWSDLDLINAPSPPYGFPFDQLHGVRLAVTGGQLLCEVGVHGFTPQSVTAVGGSVSTGVWQHVAAVANGTTLRLYINGIDTGVSEPIAAAPDCACQYDTIPPDVGCDNGNSNFFDGRMDDVRFYPGVALTAAQLANGYFDPSPPPCSCDGDVNNDGYIDANDIARVAAGLSLSPCRVSFRSNGGDINCDGDIDWCDVNALSCFINNGSNCCAPCGACCDDGICAETTETDCSISGGTWLGPGADCPNVNAALVIEPGGQVFTHVVGPPVDCTSSKPVASKPASGNCNPSGPFFDVWSSIEGSSMCHNFQSNPLPANFFEPGSEPFNGIVCVRGVPLGNPDYGDADTIVRRSGDPIDRCNLGTNFGVVSIQVVALSLESLAPLSVTTNGQPVEWNMFVDLSQVPAPAGQLFASKSHCNGGTFASSFQVQPRFTFTKVADPSQVRVLDTGVAGMPPVTFDSFNNPQSWVFDVPEGSGTNLDACSHFHPGFKDRDPHGCVDCNSNNIRDLCEIEQNPAADCNGNGVLDSCDLASEFSTDTNDNGIPDECETTSDVETSRRGPLGLEATGPNPWTASSRLWFSLATPGNVDLAIYDVAGRKVATLVRGLRPQGRQPISWNAADDSGAHVHSGVYYARLVAAGEVRTAKLVVVD